MDESDTACGSSHWAGCIWLANPHGSISWRDGQSRAGGEIINLNRDYDIIVRQQPGAGMAPVENVQTDLGIQDGGLYQRTKTQVRSIGLDGVVTGSDVADFHFKRNRLIDLFKPDGGAPDQPFLLRYTTGSAITKQIETHYDGGFELNEATANIEMFSARLIAYDPYWREIKDNAVVSTVGASAGEGRVFIQLPHGASGSEGKFYVIEGNNPPENFQKGPDGKIYWLEAQDEVNRYNLQTNSQENILSNLTNGIINDIAFDAHGNLYIAGTFSTAGSITACRIAKYDGVDFSAVADGFDNTVTTIAIDRDNTIYAGGIFGKSGSIAASGIAKLVSGSVEFAQVGDGLQSLSTAGSPRVIAIEKSGSNFYVGGQFDASGSTSLSNLAYFDGSTLQSVGSACINGEVSALAVKPDDTIFIGGSFSGVFPDAAGSPKNFAFWDGQQFSIDTNDAPRSKVTALSYSTTTGRVAVGTDGDEYGAPSIDRGGALMFWNGSVWEFGPVWTRTFGVSGMYSQDYLVIGFNAQLDPLEARTPQVTTINNGGTATAFPDLIWASPSTVSASTFIFNVENISASKAIEFDFAIWGGETVTLSLENGTAESNFKGNIIGDIRPGSNFTTWRLLPDDNIVGVLADEQSDLNLTVRWKNRYWSIDG